MIARRTPYPDSGNGSLPQVPPPPKKNKYVKVSDTNHFELKMSFFSDNFYFLPRKYSRPWEEIYPGSDIFVYMVDNFTKPKTRQAHWSLNVCFPPCLFFPLLNLQQKNKTLLAIMRVHCIDTKSKIGAGTLIMKLVNVSLFDHKLCWFSFDTSSCCVNVGVYIYNINSRRYFVYMGRRMRRLFSMPHLPLVASLRR